MADESKENVSLTPETADERVKKAREKRAIHYSEFKRKKLTEVPCLRTSFLTGK